MKKNALFSHIIALLIVLLFCIQNSLPVSFFESLPQPETIFSALIQSQLISVPLLLFPVVFTLCLPGGWSVVKSWFAKPTITFRGGCWLCFMIIFFSNIFLTVISPDEQQPIVAMFEQLAGWQVLVIAGCISLLVPCVEELLFRGVMMQGLPAPIAILYSSVLFALAHGINSYVVPIFFTGWMLAMVRLRSGSIITSIACHATLNGLSLAITFFL